MSTVKISWETFEDKTERPPLTPAQVAWHRFRRHKTTQRELYDRYRAQAQAEGIFEYIFLNEHGEIAEGTISNIFIRQDGVLYTPPLNCGALPGIMRAEVIKRETALEKPFTPEELRNADEVLLSNAIRGLIRVDQLL